MFRDARFPPCRKHGIAFLRASVVKSLCRNHTNSLRPEGSSMNVEYLARQYEITPAVRDEVEEGLGKLTKILGENFKSKVILTNEKHRFIAEITVTRRRGHLVGLAEATDMIAAIGQALEHIETQALKSNGRRRATHRKPKDKSWQAPVEADSEIESPISVGKPPAPAVPV